MKKKLLLFVSAVLVLSTNIFGSGFQINEQGARAMAMGGAFTGLANDPSAVYFNPAGIVNLQGTHFSAGVSLIAPSSSFRGPAPAVDEYELNSQLFTPFNFYFTHQLSDEWYVGFGANNPYGLGTKWDDDWVGRYLALDTEIRTFFFNPVVAYKINDQLSVSAGVTFAYGDVKIIRYTPLYPFDGEAQVSLKGDGTAWGFTAGVLYKPMEDLSFGISFRSEAPFTFEGDATSDGPDQFSALLPAGNISADFTTPMNLTFGVAVNPTECLTVTGDFQYVGWSSYDVLAVDFEDPNQTDISSERNYNNSWIARLGAEYWLSDGLALRAGFLYDKNPVDDERVEPTLPDSDRLGFNIGIGYDLTENLTLDLAYFFLRFNERKITNSDEDYALGDTPFNGVYNSTAHLYGINFSYNF